MIHADSRVRILAAVLVLATPSILAAQGTTVDEVEPNDTPAEAQPVASGTVIGGRIEDAADVDYYAIDAAAGQEIVLTSTGIYEIELTFLGPDGTTVLPGDDRYGVAAETGTHYIAVREAGGGSTSYQVSWRVQDPPSGEPVTLRPLPSSIEPGEIVGGPDGSVYVRIQETVWRVDRDGSAEIVGEGVAALLAIDVFGDLLVQRPAPDRDAVYRLSPGSGEIELFYRPEGTTYPCGSPSASVDADGGVWVAAHCYGSSSATAPEYRWMLARLDRYGQQQWLHEERLPYGPPSIAVTPDGSLVGNSIIAGGIVRVRCDEAGSILCQRDSVRQLSISHGAVHDIAVDVNGNLYVATGAEFGGHPVVLSPDGAILAWPLARDSLTGSRSLAFLRDAEGRLTSRLVATTPSDLATRGIVELAQGAATAMGYGPAVIDRIRVDTDSLPVAHPGEVYSVQLAANTGPVTWRLAAGALPDGLSLSSDGLIAGTPTALGEYPLQLAVAGNGREGRRELTLFVVSPLVVEDQTLEEATMGAAYADTLALSGGAGQGHWVVIDGAVPDGLTVDSTGAVTGVPAEHGHFDLSVRVVSGRESATVAVQLDVVEPTLEEDDVVGQLMDGSGLSEDQIRYLDLLGNRNGRLDLADVGVWMYRKWQ